MKQEQPKQKKRPYYGGGMPKGKKIKATVDKELLREELRSIVRENLQGMVSAQVANSKGVKYLIARDRLTGKFRRLTEADAKLVLGNESDREVIEVWDKDPNVSAFTDLMNRTIDKPAEQVNTEIKADITYRWQGEE